MCMGEWTTLSVREQTRNDFNEMKQEWAHEAGHNDYSADTFLGILMAVGENNAFENHGDSNEPTADYHEFIETMQSIQSSAQTAEERTGQIQRQLEEMGQR